MAAWAIDCAHMFEAGRDFFGPVPAWRRFLLSDGCIIAMLSTILREAAASGGAHPTSRFSKGAP
jgi:hypothetical protein